MFLGLCQVYVSHTYEVAYYRKCFLVHYVQVLCHSRLCTGEHAYLSYLMLRQLSLLSLVSSARDIQDAAEITPTFQTGITNKWYEVSSKTFYFQNVDIKKFLYFRF
jgi:hypothetical protein